MINVIYMCARVRINHVLREIAGQNFGKASSLVNGAHPTRIFMHTALCIECRVFLYVGTVCVASSCCHDRDPLRESGRSIIGKLIGAGNRAVAFNQNFQ